MFTTIWHTIFFDPIYNALVFFIDSVRGGDVGIAIILTVILVKLILLPVSLKAARTQLAMRELEPELQHIKEKYKDAREEQARKTMELFGKYKVNPFSSVVLLFIQIPIVIALYFAVSKGGGVPLPHINTALLYSFIPSPSEASMLFLGVIDIALKSLPLAVLAGATQFIHTHLSLPTLAPRDPKKEPSFKDDFSRSMQLQMRYVMPLIIFMVAYTISATIALYFTISNLMAIGQEFIVRHKGLKIVPSTESK
jgi:YidC/Oxa1 family membrane protein insertase